MASQATTKRRVARPKPARRTPAQTQLKTTQRQHVGKRVVARVMDNRLGGKLPASAPRGERTRFDFGRSVRRDAAGQAARPHRRGRILVGTASWTDPGFVADWDPAKLPARQRLPWYAEHFNLVEVNSSFYAI